MKVNYDKITNNKKYKYSKGGNLFSKLTNLFKRSAKVVDKKVSMSFDELMEVYAGVPGYIVNSNDKLTNILRQLDNSGISKTDKRYKQVLADIFNSTDKLDYLLPYIEKYKKSPEQYRVIVDKKRKAPFSSESKLGEQLIEKASKDNIDLNQLAEVEKFSPRLAKDSLVSQYGNTKEVEERVFNNLLDMVDNVKLDDVEKYSIHYNFLREMQKLPREGQIKKARELAAQEAKTLSDNANNLGLQMIGTDTGNLNNHKGIHLPEVKTDSYSPEDYDKHVKFMKNYVHQKADVSKSAFAGVKKDLSDLEVSHSAMLHEGSHGIQQGVLTRIVSLIRKMLTSKIESSDFFKNADPATKKQLSYLFEPAEVHSKIQEIRYTINPEDPWKALTKKDIIDFKNMSDTGNSQGHSKVFVEALEKTGLLDVVVKIANRYWALGAGVGVTTGLTYAAADNQQLRKGGKIIYKSR